VVLFHGEGGDEDAAARLIPALSRRNYIAACPRGPIALAPGANGRLGFGWGEPNRRTDDFFREILDHAQREYRIHNERVYLVGLGEGAKVAYRLGLAMPGIVAGVVALNGALQTPTARSVARLKSSRQLRVFIGHGSNNPVVPLSSARRAFRLLDAAGADVRLGLFPTTQRIHPDMLRDVNRWIMGAVNTEADATAPPAMG
jgi:phospholipase/carboxylesterase